MVNCLSWFLRAPGAPGVDLRGLRAGGEAPKDYNALMDQRAPGPRVVQTVCSHDCPDACAVQVTIDQGRAVQFRGDPRHPVTRGFLCGKVNSYQEVVHSTDRILHPLRRTGAKGEGRFEPISWEDALELTAERLRQVQAARGGEGIALYYYGGTMGYVHRYCAEALFNRLGARRLRANICYFGADAGYRAVVGTGYGVDPEDVVHSDLVLLWGCNVVTTQVHLVPFLEKARKRGAQMWSIDPYRNRSAAKSDRWVCVRPGTDTALALGLLHVLERDGGVDRDFLGHRTVGYEQLRDEVLPKYPPGRTAEITGVEAKVVEELAARLAQARAPLFKVGVGLGRNSHGGAGVRAICSLAGALGAFTKLGGGVQYDTGCEFGPLVRDPVTRPDWRTDEASELNMTDLGPALMDESSPIEFLYVHSSNPAATAPLQTQVTAGLAREDLFTVVHERFLTDTARYADVVLPAVTFVEAADLYKAYGHLYLQYAPRAMPPVGDARSNLAAIQGLGKALGYSDPWFDATEEELIEAMLDATVHPNFDGLDREALRRGEPVRLNIPRGACGFEAGFPTPSGKLEFVSPGNPDAQLAAPVDFRGDPFNERPEEYPLRLLTPPAHSFLNSSFVHEARSRRKEGDAPSLLVHPEDANGIATGDEVELFNEHGVVRLRAEISETTQPGVVVAEGTWWPTHTPGGRGINAVTSARLTDLGGGSTFHDNRVAMRKS